MNANGWVVNIIVKKMNRATVKREIVTDIYI